MMPSLLYQTLKLDVGCGLFPTGDVNCDLFKGKSPHLREWDRINPKKIRNFIRCDANMLPFKDKAFSESVCSHVLEHKGVKPFMVLREMVRVTEGKIVVVVPHRYDKEKNRLHDKVFNVSNIKPLFLRLGLKPKFKTKYRGFPSKNLSIVRLPCELTMEVYVK